MYSLRIPSLVFFLVLCLLAGCGGGGGGGGSQSVAPPLVFVGTTSFNPATSRGLNDFSNGFAVPATWSFESGAPGDPSTPLNADQSFTLSTVTVSGTVLPCYRVFHPDNADPAFDQYEWWAISTDGGLYRITVGSEDYRPGATPSPGANSDPNNPVLLSQAKLLLPGTVTVGTTWSTGACAGLNLDQTELGHLSTRTIVSTSATSPHGFPGCVKVKVEATAYTDKVWYEYWMDGAGLVEVESIYTTPTPFVDYATRADLSHSG